MILERKPSINIPELKDGQNRYLYQNLESDVPRQTLIGYAEMMQVYSAAMKEVSTRLEVLDDEFHINQRHNPIHHLECRIKGPKSIYEKMIKYDLQPSLDAAREHIQDIAGIRVICNFLDDIYMVENLLLQQFDITLINRKDYIEQPKESGYRSLHLVVKIRVFLSGKTEEVPVEIQLRTVAMDYWASLEHMLRYKNSDSDMEQYAAMLLDCSNTLADTEKTMQFIREHIE